MDQIKIYDTLTGKKVKLSRPSKGTLKLFVCGPTVYDYAHIGHARIYLIFDVLARFFKSQGIKINYLQNITDIDDKIIDRAKMEKKNPATLANIFYKEYLRDMKNLSIKNVNRYALASLHIKEIISQIDRLFKKGFAYKTKNGVYFETKKFSDYGKLSRQNLEALRPGWRTEPDPEKKDPLDFALWKYPKSEPPKKQKFLKETGTKPTLVNGEPVWWSPWGYGRPGWHIEDTAITEKYFGEEYDLHGGAVDLKFPHHESEIAQSRSLSGKKNFVKIWLHAGLLLIENEKMSKSLNNFVKIRDFLKKYPAEILRLLILTHHYRSPLNYTDRLAWENKKAWNDLKEFFGKLALVKKQKKPKEINDKKNKKANPVDLEKLEKKFFSSLFDDLNTSEAIAAILSQIKEIQPLIWQISPKNAEEIDKKITKLLNVLGFTVKSAEINPKVKKIAEERDKLRRNQQFIQADSLRKKINSLGFAVEDTPLGSFLWPLNL